MSLPYSNMLTGLSIGSDAYQNFLRTRKHHTLQRRPEQSAISECFALSPSQIRGYSKFIEKSGCFFTFTNSLRDVCQQSATYAAQCGRLWQPSVEQCGSPVWSSVEQCSSPVRSSVATQCGRVWQPTESMRMSFRECHNLSFGRNGHLQLTWPTPGFYPE